MHNLMLLLGVDVDVWQELRFTVPLMPLDQVASHWTTCLFYTLAMKEGTNAGEVQRWLSRLLPGRAAMHQATGNLFFVYSISDLWMCPF